MINVSLLSSSSSRTTTLKIFGKKSGNTSLLIKYKDGSIVNYHVYVNENLGFIQKMINIIEPTLKLNKIGDASTVITGTFKDPHNKKRIYNLLEKAGLNLDTLMDLTETQQVNKMVRTKLYLVEISNRKAKDLGGVTGLSFFDKYLHASVNPLSANSATFSGWLLDNTGALSAQQGTSITSTLNFLQESGIGTILDDTVLMTTEDENASFRVGGDVYIPIGVTQNIGGLAPTITLEEKEYGLSLMLTSQFMEKDGYMHINVKIEDSSFDTNSEHNVNLGENISVPAFLSKNINTNVVVKSGQVIALGGRLHTEEIDKEEKIPWLGDLPFIGELFTHTVSGTTQNDLLFFLVPEIIDANENINDTDFYNKFKASSKLFHAQIMEDNETTVEDEKPINVKVTDVDDEVMIIEVEDTNSSHVQEDENSSSSKELVIETVDDEEKAPVILKIEAVKKVEKKPLKIEIVEVKETPKKIQKATLVKKYSVVSDKIFLRNKPSVGKRTNVWLKGHKFTIGEEKTVNGATWVKVKENCYEGCVPENRELWIAKKYIKEI
jgi:pilus assembly protein CpaC